MLPSSTVESYFIVAGTVDHQKQLSQVLFVLDMERTNLIRGKFACEATSHDPSVVCLGASAQGVMQSQYIAAKKLAKQWRVLKLRAVPEELPVFSWFYCRDTGEIHGLSAVVLRFGSFYPGRTDGQDIWGAYITDLLYWSSEASIVGVVLIVDQSMCKLASKVVLSCSCKKKAS